MADPFSSVRGSAAAMLSANIDTDTISPGSRSAARAAKAEFSEKGSATLAADLFAGLRYDEAGAEQPDFILNRPQFRNAKILLAGANFGCGSSRESAVWMLKEWGLRCIIAPSFGEIFHASCFKNGLLAVQLGPDVIAHLAVEAEPGEPTAIFEVDLTRSLITTPSGRHIAFEIAQIRRDALLGGLDEIALTLERADVIGRFEQVAERSAPWLYRTAARAGRSGGAVPR